MPRDHTAAHNQWPNELCCRWWEEVCQHRTEGPEDAVFPPGGVGNSVAEMLPYRQAAAEAWAREHRPELLAELRTPNPVPQAAPEPQQTVWTSGNYRFTTKQARDFYRGMLDGPSRFSSAASNFAMAGVVTQESYMRSHWDELMEGDYEPPAPPTSPWALHRRGPNNAETVDEEWPYLVHGYLFQSQRSAGYFTTLLNLRADDSDEILTFPNWSEEGQSGWITNHPLERQVTPIYPTPTMPITRDSTGRFASTPKKKPKVMFYHLLYDMIMKAVHDRKDGDEKAQKKPRSSPDKIMEHFKDRSLRPSLYKCVPSGVWREDGEFTWVYIDSENRDKTQPWDGYHASANAVRCLATHQWYARDEFEFVQIHEHQGRGKCELQNVRDRGWCQWADGRWHDRRPPPTPEDRQAAIRSQGGNEIPQYHAIRPEWRDGHVAAKEPLYGIELEIQSKKRREICTIAEQLGFIGEQDGTLCRQTGLEIIAPPFTFDQIKDEKGKWLTFLKSIQGQVRGWDAGTNYGMHVSISRETLKKDHQIRLMCFVHDSRGLCEVVAGREANQWCTFKKKPRDERCLIQDMLPDGRPDKYESCCIRGEHRIEMRIFRSTVSVEGFLRNVEFTVASVDYSRTNDPSQDKFLEWVRQAEITKKYPNLAKFLAAKSGEIKAMPPVEQQEEMFTEPPRGRVRPTLRFNIGQPAPDFDEGYARAMLRAQESLQRADQTIPSPWATMLNDSDTIA